MYLNCHTYYSLRYGTMSVEQLVQQAVAAGTDTIVLTDINNSTAVPEFAGECIKNNVRPLAGIEFRKENELLYTGVARNNRGMRELNELLSYHNFNKTPIPFPAPPLSESYIIYSLGKIPERKLFVNERIGIRTGEINRLLTMNRNTGRESMVLLQPVTFASDDDIAVHRSLRAVDNNILLSHLQPWQCATGDEFFKTAAMNKKIADDHPWLAVN